MTESVSDRSQGPIFVVGSPRSGTSVLTWCLGQHPNILPQEESGWIGPLAVDLAVRYGMGCTHGERSQLSALGISRDQFLDAFGSSIDSMILGRREAQEALCRASAERDPTQICDTLQLARSPSDSKSRWVDGTPEYSMQIYSLKKLFPNAKFVHIARDVRAVVDSMLHFKFNGRVGLVDTEQGAYEYWLHAVRACVQAEAALGSREVLRVRYDDLVQKPELTLRRILAFLNEPFDSACLEPLLRKINSSNVPADALATDRVIDPATDRRVVDAATRLSDRLQATEKAFEPSASLMRELEIAFEERVNYVAGLDNDHDLEVKKAAMLTSRLNRIGLLLISNLLIGLMAALLSENDSDPDIINMIWPATALIGLCAYVYMRRAGLREMLRKFSRKQAEARIFRRRVPNHALNEKSSAPNQTFGKPIAK